MVKTRGSRAQSGERALKLVKRVFYRSVLLTHMEKQRSRVGPSLNARRLAYALALYGVYACAGTCASVRSNV